MVAPRLLVASALAVSASTAAGAASSAETWKGAKPHIVLVLADDYGWANFGPHRHDASLQAQAEVHTPNLDGLVDDGVLLDRHYSYKICSPARSSLQSGRLAVHVNTFNAATTLHNASDPVSGFSGIPRNMTGMAKKMRSAGYRTHMVGKWDAGAASPEQTPEGRGYESWVGYYQHSNDYWRMTYELGVAADVDNCLNSFVDISMHNATYRGGLRDGPTVSPECLTKPQGKPQCYEEEVFKARALEVIRDHDISDESAPLFLFYSFHLVHSPLEVPDSYVDRIDDIVKKAGAEPFDSKNRRLYAAMTLYMDEAIGEVVDALKAKGMWDNTLLVFSADNGGPIYEPGSANNYPLKGGKFADWEGGVRVNAFVSGGFVPEEKRGGVFAGVMSLADWYGTFCELAGVDMVDLEAKKANEWLRPRGLPLLPPVDSVAQWGHIMSGTNGRPELHLSEQALLQWPYKLVTGTQIYSRWLGELYPNCTTVEVLKKGGGPLPEHLTIFDKQFPFDKSEDVAWPEDCGDGCLFDVRADPEERMDLAAKLTKIKESMQARLKDLNIGIFKPHRGDMQFAACEVLIERGGFVGPWVDAEDWYTPQEPPSRGEHHLGELLRLELKQVNREVAELGIQALFNKLMPKLRHHSEEHADQCLRPASTATSAAGDPVMVV